MAQTQDRGGRTRSTNTVQRQVARVLNKSAHQLAESVLAKALTGDSGAQQAAVEMLKLANPSK